MELSQAFVGTCLAWESEIPKALRYENRRILYQILKLAGSKEGINQTALRSALEVTQPRLSQIKAKLVRQKWVEVWRPEKDRRNLLMTITPAARRFVDAVELKIAAAMKSASGSRKRTPAAPGPIHAEAPQIQPGAQQTLFGGTTQSPRTRL
jgi:DNA-binding MarR family transcriptional regulator